MHEADARIAGRTLTIGILLPHRPADKPQALPDLPNSPADSSNSLLGRGHRGQLSLAIAGVTTRASKNST